MEWEIIFWATIAILGWTWIGYPALLVSLTGVGRRGMRIKHSRGTCDGPAAPLNPSEVPKISIIVPVHNKERVLAEKLQNCFELDYPDQMVEIIVGCDGCVDRSVEIARGFDRGPRAVHVLEAPGRVGKSVIQNMAAERASGAILLLTDADTLLLSNALHLLARRFSRGEIGCVSGHIVWGSSADPCRAWSDNLYWRFEHQLWKCEEFMGTLAWASGACMAVQKALFHGIDPQYGDDVIVPLDVAGAGARVAYEPALVAVEESTENPGAALRARARMTLRSLGGTVSRWRVYSPLRRPGLFVAVLSHKLLRWATPFLFLGLFGAAIRLSVEGAVVPLALVALQLSGCTLAVVGHIAQRARVSLPFALAIRDFALENVGILMGVIGVTLGRRMTVWDRPDVPAPDPWRISAWGERTQAAENAGSSPPSAARRRP